MLLIFTPNSGKGKSNERIAGRGLPPFGRTVASPAAGGNDDVLHAFGFVGARRGVAAGLQRGLPEELAALLVEGAGSLRAVYLAPKPLIRTAFFLNIC